MTTDTGGGGGNTFLGFMVGALLVVVAILGFFMFTGGHISLQNGGPPTVNLTVKPPVMPKPAAQ